MKKQNGFAPILLIAVAVVVVAAVGVGYSFVRKQAPGGNKGILPKVNLPGGVGLNADCELKDPELCRFIDKMAKSETTVTSNFSGRSVIVDKSGKASETRWEMQGDKTHFQNTTDGKETFNTITIGDTTYTKDLADGKWFKYTVKSGASSSGGFFNVDEIKNSMKETVKEMQDKTSYKSMGKAKCGNLTCFKYQVISTLTPDSQQYLYFDDREYLMRMMEVVADEGTTTTYFDYRQVSITAPSPVKEGEVGSMFNPADLERFSGEEASSLDMTELQNKAQEFMQNLPEEAESPPAGSGE